MVGFADVSAQREVEGRFYCAPLDGYVKQPISLVERMERCERDTSKLKLPCDLILQFRTLLGVLNLLEAFPYVALIDFTARMAKKYYPPWAWCAQGEPEASNVLEKEMYRRADLILVTKDLVLDSLVNYHEVSADKLAVVGWGAHVELLEDFDKPTNHVLIFAGHDPDQHGGQSALEIFEAIRGQLLDISL